MATNSLSHNEWKIYHHNETITDLNECIAKMSSLVEVALAGDFTQYEAEIMHNYWWVLDDLLRSVKMLCEELDTTELPLTQQ